MLSMSGCYPFHGASRETFDACLRTTGVEAGIDPLYLFTFVIF